MKARAKDESCSRTGPQPNGYVLEQVFSPLVVVGGPVHEELKDLVRGCITRHHVHHYLGFAHGQWKRFAKASPPRVKPLLYVYRVLLTGIHLMRTGRVEANLIVLLEDHDLEGVEDLIARKTAGGERGTLETASLALHERQCRALTERLEREGAVTDLPDRPSTRSGLSDFLVRLGLDPPGAHA